MNLSNVDIKHVSIHYIGGKLNGQPLLLSKNEILLEQNKKQDFIEALLNKFSNTYERYAFYHPSSLKFNEVYNFVVNIFSNDSDFHQQSKNIATHLYESSLHPRIKSGELYVCHFSNVQIDNYLTQAIGFFKTEAKSLFFELNNVKDEFDLKLKKGVEPSKIEKGCLIFDRSPENGFEVLIFDNQSKSAEAQYWRDSFLSLAILQNEFHNTNQFLTLTKQFVVEAIADDPSYSKTDQIDILNKSVDYFKANDVFDLGEFEKSVFDKPELIQSFRSFENSFSELHELELPNSFEISSAAVKKQARVFKSVLKLDKNFHIYIHGNKELIEKGIEKDGRKYYKIYYEEEA